MQWSDEVQTQISALTPVEANEALLQKLIKLIDLTNLNENDSQSSIAVFSDKAQTSLGDVAAVCTYPQWVGMMSALFDGTKVKVATVANFPSGTDSIEQTLVTINSVLEHGASEIDIVFPYQKFLKGDTQYPADFVAACRDACGENTLLKIILETGAYQNEDQIVTASAIAIENGADFIKTSTGKHQHGSSLHAACAMLLVIMQLTPGSKRPIGLKVSGGIHYVSQAAQYLELADNIMGKSWVSPRTFRIGTSKLVDEMLKEFI